ncbi:hypothetical protein ESY86_19800 [Subsaximicrobium wynnwilliamsii]|uniref:JAB domain-containing protein n=1 Tax=Subsaximicrobium wynnwilliamsii TaxID=291179 RepID=A0A5C6ZAR7_9FLAO|nr:hypothetical protein [Subsaximicrobium wynnwilliamsii]TXD80890.1 hypothetical protein ESY87_19910 [Subsaximicrobium wynnwilliamsii]TXD86596.1 hypothetical protein ESY86_19800 [Subsaximicrobium wynnwilliamsii]TXE00188.1 hypothetical protein ESY88_19860 [Subsaximicrobium wynnwilliamsii]
MKNKRIKNYLKFGILLFGISVIVIACQKDDNVSTEQNSERKIPQIETISYDDANTTFSNLKAQYNLDRYKATKFAGNIQAKSTTDTLGLIIETDIIKQATLGDYTSYTMKIVHQNDSTVFYNLTIEYKNGESAMFITKYTPTEYWLNNKGEVYQGEVQSKSATLTQYTDPEDAFEEGYTGNPELGSGPGGGGGAIYDANYPSGCLGTVIATTAYEAYPCDCGHMPWDNTCQGCTTNPKWPGFEEVIMYTCEESWDINDPYDPGDTGNPGGGSLPDPTEDDPSITVTIRPEECTERVTGDLDGDCALDAYELCLLNGNDQEVCDCVADGNELLDCIEPKTDCESLSLLVANDSLGSNILPIVNQLRTKLGTNDNEWSISYENVWSEDGRKNVPDTEDGIREGTSRTRSKSKSGNLWVGQIHTHPLNTYKVFSWLDLRALKLIYEDVNNHFKQDVFLMAVAPNNETYAMKVNDIAALISKIDADWTNASGTTNQEKESDIEKVMVDKYSISSNQEQAFLELYGDYGISFYKATDANLSNWKLLELDENNNQTVNETPCN